MLADPLAGLLDRLAFSRSPDLRADRAALRRTEAALPLRSANPLDGVDDDTFARLTRRALGHYGDLSKLVASPLTALPVIDERLAARGAPDQPLERANELKALLADRIARLKPRDGGDFGTTEQWRHYNSLYFPYVVGVRAYAQNATAAGLDPVARQAWQWFVTEVPQRSLHNWQNAAARLIAADLRGNLVDRARLTESAPSDLRLAVAGSVWRRSGSGVLSNLSAMTAINTRPVRETRDNVAAAALRRLPVAFRPPRRRHPVRRRSACSSRWRPTRCRGCPVCRPRRSGSAAPPW